jgi:GntR family histidine utilization transcriptional repressor
MIETPMTEDHDETDDGDRPVPMHQRILSDIEGRILSGEWGPGFRIPFENDLAEHYGCSRMTANKALVQLARTGLIERRRKSGSFVRQPVSQAAILDIHDIAAEVKALGLAYRYERLARERRIANAEDRKRLAIARNGHVLSVSGLHLAAAKPFCLEERLISLVAVPEAEAEEFLDVSPGPWLIERVPWSAAEHRIRARPADSRTARLLGLAEGAACLVIERRTWSNNQDITHVRLTYPGETHELVANFAP